MIGMTCQSWINYFHTIFFKSFCQIQRIVTMLLHSQMKCSHIFQNTGACMLLGPTMDSLRASSILKNMRTLHLRMKQHSHNELYLAEAFETDGVKVVYQG